MACPNFFVGVRTFSKGDLDKKVYTPVPLVENAFVSDEARKSYGFVPEDSPFVVTVTREFMETSLSQGRDGEIPGVFHDEFDKRQPARHTLGTISLVLGEGGLQATCEGGFPPRRRETHSFAQNVYSHVFWCGNQFSSQYVSVCARTSVQSLSRRHDKFNSAGLWPFDRSNSLFTGAGPEDDKDGFVGASLRNRGVGFPGTSPDDIRTDPRLVWTTLCEPHVETSQHSQ